MKKILVVLIGLALLGSGCAVKSIIYGRSVCKPSVLSDKKITIDCDWFDYKNDLTQYFIGNGWSVFEGPVFKSAEYVYTNGSSTAQASSFMSANLVALGGASSVAAGETTRKITTNGQLDQKTELLLRVDKVKNNLVLKMIDFKTQEIVFDLVCPNDDYSIRYLDFCTQIHAQRGIKDIVFTKIVMKSSPNGVSFLDGVTVNLDGAEEEYTYDSKTRAL